MTALWPPDYLCEYRRRIALMDDAQSDMALRAALKIHYTENPVDFINDWCITIDPRAVSPAPRIMPFILFQRQREFVQFLQECLRDKESGLVEKSRDMGATWCACAFAVWLWLFHPASIIGFGSRKEEYVDHRGDPKAIFPKIRDILAYLPNFLLPPKFDLDKHATYMRIINPENDSVIAGEAGSSQGRGGRSTMFFKDEAAHYEQAELIEAAVGDNTDVSIDISSVNGTNNVFYKKRMAGEVWYPDGNKIIGKTRIFIFDWRDNPFKTQEWYETRKNRAQKEGLSHIFAQEVDRNYSASIERIVIHPDWTNAAVDAHKKLGFAGEGEKIAGVDCADGGGDKNAITIRHGAIIRYTDCWGGEAGPAAQIAIPICIEYGVSALAFDSIGVGAGFKVEINNMRAHGAVPKHMRVMPWNAGSAPVDPEDNIIPGDSQSPTNADQYANLKAQAWFRLRGRFYKTYRAVVHGDQYPAHELISLDSTMPRLHELKNELSQAQYKSGINGKTLIDKRPEGSSSPNLADSCVIAFLHNVEGVSIFDVI